jgi:glycerol-3-phosphate acyltransferase PlsX
MLRIGLDVMGGDFAPDSALNGALLAHSAWSRDFRLVLFGQAEAIGPFLEKHSDFAASCDVVFTEQVIDMAASPVRALVENPNSSIVKGLEALHAGQIDGFASAGNTGAMLAGAVLKLGSIREDIRPCLLGCLPRPGGTDGILLDVGAIADTKAETLRDLALLGHVYAQTVMGIESPKIGLLSIGEEPEKGNAVTVAGHKLLAEMESIHFVGNVEGRDIFSSKADVVVTGGFTGNVIVKLSEKFFEIAEELGCAHLPFFSRLNYETYGGSPILGVNKPAVVGHGISSPLAVQNMIWLTYDVARTGLCERILSALKHE